MFIIALCIALVIGIVLGGWVMHTYMLRYHEMAIIAEADKDRRCRALQIDALRGDLSTMNARLLALNGMVDVNPWASPGHLRPAM